MNRRAFFRSLLIGGIVVPTLPKKLILTGGWFGASRPIDFNREVLTHDMLCRLYSQKILGYTFRADPFPLTVGPFKANALSTIKTELRIR
jgi:hypothetical protein